MWFTECGNACWIGYASPAGTLTYLPHRFSNLDSLAVASDSSVWFTEGKGIVTKPARPWVAKTDASGAIHTYYLGPVQTGYFISAIVAGPDGRLWFNNSGKISAITTAGQITNYSATALALGSGQNELVFGPGGRLFYSDATTYHLCYVSTSGTGKCLSSGGEPLMQYGSVLFAQLSTGTVALDSALHVTPVSNPGFVPFVETSANGLWGIVGGLPPNDGLTQLHYANGALSGITFPETDAERRYGQLIDRAVYASDGHVWAHGALELSLGDYLIRMR
ncbi:MAG: hypothetical protein JO347_10830 [Candidatus Eremiobacteraeota bacterium]|nr:hypothetical protein [Candidatus Eremiobacteraeota bacterium]